MRQRLLFFILSGFLALLVTILIRGALRPKKSVVTLPSPSVPIALAARALATGDTIDGGSIRFAPWPRATLPAGAIVNSADIIGKTLRTSLLLDQPIVSAALVDSQSAGGILPLIIPPGMRAMSVAVDDVGDMAGLVLPHARVDVLVSASVPSNGSTTVQVSKIVLQDIEVVAVGENVDSAGQKSHPAKVITLLLRPGDAERLATAMHLGTLELAMRNYRDRDLVATRGVDTDQLLDIPPPFSPAIRRAPVQFTAPGVEIIRDGKEHQRIEFIGGQPVESGADTNASLPTYVAPAGHADTNSSAAADR